MSFHQHTFFYKDEADYVRQLDMELQRLLAVRMEDYRVIRSRYPGLKAPAFTMRLKRFLRAGGTFPHATGRKGKRILEMAVTPALDAWLRK